MNVVNKKFTIIEIQYKLEAQKLKHDYKLRELKISIKISKSWVESFVYQII